MSQYYNPHNLNIILAESEGLPREISRSVLRQKLSHNLRHLVLKQAIQPSYLDYLFSTQILPLFQPQTVTYNGGIAQITQWKISCYLEVMEGAVPTASPHVKLRDACWDLLETCNYMFAMWNKQQYGIKGDALPRVERLMTFITRYTVNPGEQALLKVRTVYLRLRLEFVSFLPNAKNCLALFLRYCLSFLRQLLLVDLLSY